jgi:hypothetical protein
MERLYKHTQIGTVILASLALPAIILWTQKLSGNLPTLVTLPTLSIVALVAVLFPTLTTEVYRDRVRLYFGAGLIHRTIEMREIAAANVVHNSWSNGWGIRFNPGRGWMWNVSGLTAVELTLKSGKQFRIGTDDPEQLLNVIRSQTSAS